MIKHLNQQKNPERVVILGGTGVIGQALQERLSHLHIPYLSLGSAELDLSQNSSVEKLVSTLQPSDTVVFLSTITPNRGRGIEAFCRNIQFAENFCKALEKVTPSHVIYLSSDTVYSLDRGLISEESPLDPENLFGAMHLAREYMIKESSKAPTAMLRSTLVYSANDTHNSYGPNRMRRQAQNEGKIPLFGGGEERRDHIFVEDLATIIGLVVLNKSEGVLNLATGVSTSYRELAEKTASLFDTPVEIVPSERKNPITHRHFDVSQIFKSFPSFSFTPLDVGLKKAYEGEFTVQKI